MHFCPVLLDSNLSDGVGVVLEPEGKPPTQSQTWSNPRFNLLPEMISAASHMSYCMLNIALLYICLSVYHSLSRDDGRVARLSRRNGGIITTVRLALRGFVWFFPLRRGEERTNVVL